MEKPNFNNQSKAEIEKAPQENEESLSTQEQESGKRENITLEIDGQKIEKKSNIKTLTIEDVGDFEYMETYIEFPEYLVKETGGVKGYFKKTFEPIESIKNKIEMSYEGEPNRKYEFIKRKLTDLYDKVTNGEFLHKTSLNTIRGVWMDRYVNNITEHFKEDKLYLQKIFGDQRVGYKINTEGIFFIDNSGNLKKNMVYHDINMYHNSSITKKIFIEKKKKRDLRQIDDESRKSFEDGGYFNFLDSFLESVSNPKEDTSIIMLGRSGLHVTNQDKTGDDGFSGNIDFLAENVFSGFSIKNKAFKQYLENIETFIEKIPYNQEIPYQRSRRTLTEVDKSHDIFDISLRSIKYFLQEKMNMKEARLIDHPAIPIIHGHPNISSLRWCHSSYMSIPTKKGLSILEFIT